MDEKFTFFWFGPLSQWHRENFVVEGITYNCTEQFMMSEKARLFNDTESLTKIMKETSPKQQKAYGRTVKGFDLLRWEANARTIVYRGNYAKFKQNQKPREILFASAGTILVEASPVDCIWGVGLDEKNPLILNRSTWRGKNWLGETLTRVRDDLMKEL